MPTPLRTVCNFYDEFPERESNPCMFCSSLFVRTCFQVTGYQEIVLYIWKGKCGTHYYFNFPGKKKRLSFKKCKIFDNTNTEKPTQADLNQKQ